jgi:hypothetical protein
MAKTHTLIIGSWKLRMTNIKDKEEDYKTVDKDNRELEYIPGKVERGYYVDPVTKDKVLNTYKSIKGKPCGKFKQTEVVKTFKEVSIQELFDLKEKHLYYIEDVPNDLMAKLKEGKAIKLVYSPGNGYSAYYGIIYHSTFHDKILMKLGNAFIGEQINDIDNGRDSDNKLKDVTLQEDGVERVKEEDILTL